jgi:hypothetical protein
VNSGENPDMTDDSRIGSMNRPEDSVPSPLDISQADPVYLFNEYMRVVETDLTLNPSDSSSNTVKKNKNDINATLSELDNIENQNNKIFLHNTVITEGLRTLDRILNENSINGSMNMVGESRVKSNNFFNLNLHTVSLLNFGPYGGERVDYPLQKR